MAWGTPRNVGLANIAAGASPVLTLTGAVNVDDILFIFVSEDNSNSGQIGTIAAVGGNTFGGGTGNLTGGINASGTGGSAGVFTSKITATLASGTNITYTRGAGTGGICMAAIAVAGGDAAIGNSGAVVNGTTSPLASSSVTPATAGCMFFQFATGPLNTTTWTEDAAWTQVHNQAGSASQFGIITGYLIEPA
jgi:hypothetical protein